MRSEVISFRGPSENDSSFRPVQLAKLTSLFFYSYLAITAVALFVPLNPRMPARGLDASWQFAMNEAVARHMSFGKSVVFTYGPYGAICTRNYHPATDGRMMWGSLLLIVSYVAAMLFLSRGLKRHIVVILLLFLATFGTSELLLLSYSFLLTVCVIKQIGSKDNDGAFDLTWSRGLAVVVMWSTLGLLPLIKGSLLLPFVASLAISSALLLYRSRFKQALVLPLIPIAAAVCFWLLADQSLADLPAYLRGTIALTSGYTEAMSTSWAVLPSAIGDGLVLAFLTVSGFIFASISRAPRLTAASRWLLASLCAVFLLVAFKHGFIAAAAVSSAFSSFAVFIIIIGFLYIDKTLIWSLSIVMLLTAATSITRDVTLVNEVHEKFGVGAAWSGGRRGDVLAFCVERAIGAYSRTTYKSTWGKYTDAWEGLYARISQKDGLAARFDKAKADIRNGYAPPALSGTADIYEYDQSVLLASSDEWNPRPVIQSYSAYTPLLATLNERHLRASDAPDWVLFDLQSIDGRLPSLDDGLSWSALFDNYSFTSYDGQFVLMHKNSVVRSSSNYDGISKTICMTGATVTLPVTDEPLFAEVDLKPTLAGRLLIALFNPPQLRIVVRLGDGSIRNYRVVSNMMTTGFLVSPLVSNTGEFASLAAGSSPPKRDQRVESFAIVPSYGGSAFWSDSYALTLKRYMRK